jgi:hypothetical protein
MVWFADMVSWLDGGMDETSKSRCVDTTSTLALYQGCNTIVTRIEIIIMRLRKDKGVRIKGALQATHDPNVLNNNTGISLYLV